MLPKNFWRWLAVIFVVSWMVGACVSGVRDADEWQKQQSDPAIAHLTDR